jgi:hypothetical protein
MESEPRPCAGGERDDTRGKTFRAEAGAPRYPGDARTTALSIAAPLAGEPAESGRPATHSWASARRPATSTIVSPAGVAASLGTPAKPPARTPSKERWTWRRRPRRNRGPEPEAPRPPAPSTRAKTLPPALARRATQKADDVLSGEEAARRLAEFTVEVCRPVAVGIGPCPDVRPPDKLPECRPPGTLSFTTGGWVAPAASFLR